MQFKHIVTLFAAAIVLQGCWKKSGTWKNEQINPSDRADFHHLNDQLLGYLKSDDNDHLKSLEARALIDDGSVIKSVNEISNLFRKSDYKLCDEYYVVNKYKDADTILNHLPGINNYKVRYGNVSHEMYIAFFLPKTNLANQWMIGAVFNKLSYGWKLTMLDFGMYTINGKTAPELREMAEDQFHKHYLIAAGNTIQMAYSIKRPVAVWVYTREDSIDMSYWRIAAAVTAKIKLPIVLNTIPSHPSIFRIFAGQMDDDDGYYPKVYYQTSINISDTAAVRKENNAIMKALPAILPGIDQDTPRLLFTAFNKKPNAQENVPRYEMDNRLK
jgi:hypothetical protein